MKKNLSICIPTYNRQTYLKEGLSYLLPQVKGKNEVEVVILDNASPDETEALVQEYISEHPNLRYFRNARNLGYAGNQVKCIEHAEGEYIAILCDDDIYTSGLVEKILGVIKKGEYAFIALNYYSFKKDVHRPHLVDFAPEKDVLFTRAYDIMNYPSVGHFSGFIFNARLVKVTLADLLSHRPLSYYEKHRGVISDLAVRTTLASKLPAYFIGERKLAARDPQQVDYDTLKHSCLIYYEYYKELYCEGLLTSADLAYRKKLVLSWLPFAIARDSHVFNTQEIAGMRRKFFRYFKGEPKFVFFIYPVLLLASFSPVRKFYRMIFDLKQLLRRAKRGLTRWEKE